MLNRLNFYDVGSTSNKLNGIASYIVVFQPFVDIQSGISFRFHIVRFQTFVRPGKLQYENSVQNM